MVVFDLVIDNADRKGGHVLLEVSDRGRPPSAVAGGSGRSTTASASTSCPSCGRWPGTSPASRSPMRILLLSWEYPPHVVGGLGRHVAALARTLVAQGHEVHVVTRDHPDEPAPLDEWVDGIHVVRVRRRRRSSRSRT
jgi:glycogen synthase